MREYDVNTFAGLRSAIQNHRDFPETDRLVGAFFIRHFPKLLRSIYDILADVSICVALLRDVDDRKAKDRALKTILKRHIRLLEDQIKEMIGTRKRGGSKGRLEINRRYSLHVQYEEFLQIGKTVKKHYNEVFRIFDQSRKAYKRKEWRDFWCSHATALYDYEPEYLSLFSEAGDPSASEVTYRWLSKETGHAVSYIRRLVGESRRRKK